MRNQSLKDSVVDKIFGSGLKDVLQSNTIANAMRTDWFNKERQPVEFLQNSQHRMTTKTKYTNQHNKH